MQLREMYAGEKWDGEHIKEPGRCERKSRGHEKFSQRNQSYMNKMKSKQKLNIFILTMDHIHTLHVTGVTRNEEQAEDYQQTP